MKKWLYPIALFLAVGILPRLPHPAQDIAKLDPVRTVWLYMEEDSFHIRTDTGDHGSGRSLSDAEADLRQKGSKEIYLETAEFLILSDDVPITEELFTILHPDCRVIFSDISPDLSAASDYLSAHPPKLRLAHLRAAAGA